MSKKDFVSLILSVVGGILFALGMCMALLPEWGAMTTKGAGRGYGLKIMEGVAHRYQSELRLKAEAGIFLAQTALLMP